LIASYAAIATAAISGPALVRRRRIARLRLGARPRRRPTASRVAGTAIALGLVALLVAWIPAGGATPAGTAPGGLRITVLDVGQGDAILFQPGAAPAVLIDGGPPGDGLGGLLQERGVGGLAAAIVTHDQADHAGGIAELLGQVPVERLVYGAIDRRLLGEARAAGARPRRVAEGKELRSGRLRLDVVWPPPELLDESRPGQDPNRLALVIVARWSGFSMLLTADAEAESTPIDPGHVDVLKVSHHGSDDAGLDGLLERTAPGLAVISVGEENPYGHPTGATLATLAAHGVRTMRTDRDGSVVIEVRGASVTASGEG
jgi:competence protein ComEC